MLLCSGSRITIAFLQWRCELSGKIISYQGLSRVVNVFDSLCQSPQTCLGAFSFEGEGEMESQCEAREGAGTQSRLRESAMIRGGTKPRKVACVYARFSTRFQDSIDDQVRECREWAECHGYSVPDEYVFIDRAKRGGSSRRVGLKAMQAKIKAKKVHAVVIFATSRLFRKTYRALHFVHEEVVEQGIRCVFVNSRIDTANKDDWETRLHVQSMVDEFQAKSTKAHIRAAHVGLFLKGRVFGTLSFGYKGEEIPGQTTKSGIPARRIVPDPETVPWVVKVFTWFVSERLSAAAIVRRLNEHGAPLSPRCGTGRWTYLAVKTMLTNTRYMGRWQYGRTEARWLSGKDYVRQVEREEPLKTEQIEELRIVDDATWLEAQTLLTTNPHNAGRKPVDGDRKSRPRLLNGLLYCAYHDRPLVVSGGKGRSAICPVCKESGEAKLYTFLNRRLALQAVCSKAAGLIRDDGKLVDDIIIACRSIADARQRPAPGRAQELKALRRKLTQQVGFVIGTFAESEEDRRENQVKVAELRRRRAGIDAELARMKSPDQQAVTVPTPEQVRDLLAELSSTLLEAADSTDEDLAHRTRRIMETVTGGKINVFQAGPREPGKGWLRGTFKVSAVKLVAERFNAREVEGGSTEVEVEFRQPTTHERIAGQVKELWDAGLKYEEIAYRIGCNRNLVAKSLRYWHEIRGLDAPDGRRHVKRLRRKPPLAERITEQVMDLVGEDVPLTEIAARLGTGRNQITRAIRVYHERLGQPVPDGRTLRKLRNQRRRRPN